MNDAEPEITTHLQKRLFTSRFPLFNGMIRSWPLYTRDAHAAKM